MNIIASPTHAPAFMPSSHDKAGLRLVCNFQLGLTTVFLVHACLIYPSLNRIASLEIYNRALLVSAALGCIVVGLYRSVLQRQRVLIHPVGLAIAIYFAYIALSFLLSLGAGNIPSGETKTFVLNCFLPALFYFAYVNTPNRRAILYVITLVVVINAVIAVASSPLVDLHIPVIHQLAMEASSNYGNTRLNSLIGKSTILGYFSLVVLASYVMLPKLKARLVVLPLLLLTTLLSFQRGVWIGYPLILGLTAIDRRVRFGKKFVITCTIALGIVVTAWLIFAFAKDSQKLILVLSSKVNNTTLDQALSERSFQQIIYNDNHWYFMLIGEGFGKYSALIPFNPVAQPDAPYHMIYNETGLLGMLVFFNILFQVGWHAVKTRNLLLLFVIVHFAIQMMGSRVLWMFPTNFLFYMLLAIFQNPFPSGEGLETRAGRGLTAST